MNSAIAKAEAIFKSKLNASLHLRAALFHSSPVLDRRKNDFHESRRKYYARTSRKKQREELHRSATSYAERLFKKIEREFKESGPSSSGDASWFRRLHSKKPRNGPTNNQGFYRRGRSGNRHFFWSFIQDEEPHWRSSSRYKFEEGFESDSTEHDTSKSDRTALGLSPSGPLKINDVKEAYRACAMKWHPDRHQGASKTDAEEKFKLCSAAYQSLCEKLALN